MSPNDFPEWAKKLQLLHRVYQRAAQTELPLNHHELTLWTAYAQAGLDAQDLLITTRYLRRRVESGHRPEDCLRLENLIGDLRKFQDNLALAQSALRS